MKPQVPVHDTCGYRHVGPHCPGTYSPSDTAKAAENAAAETAWEAQQAGGAPSETGSQPAATTTAPTPPPVRPGGAGWGLAGTAWASPAQSEPVAVTPDGLSSTLETISELLLQIATVGEQCQTAQVVYLPDGSGVIHLDGMPSIYVSHISTVKIEIE